MDEACKILDIEPSKITPDAVKKKYDYLFDVNSKEKSGSFYLQSKVYRSMERLMYEYERNNPGKTNPTAGATK